MANKFVQKGLRTSMTTPVVPLRKPSCQIMLIPLKWNCLEKGYFWFASWFWNDLLKKGLEIIKSFHFGTWERA